MQKATFLCTKKCNPAEEAQSYSGVKAPSKLLQSIWKKLEALPQATQIKKTLTLLKQKTTHRELDRIWYVGNKKEILS